MNKKKHTPTDVTCARCGKHFIANRAKRNFCPECKVVIQREKVKAYRLANPDKVRDTKQRYYRKTHPNAMQWRTITCTLCGVTFVHKKHADTDHCPSCAKLLKTKKREDEAAKRKEAARALASERRVVRNPISFGAKSQSGKLKSEPKEEQKYFRRQVVDWSGCTVYRTCKHCGKRFLKQDEETWYCPECMQLPREEREYEPWRNPNPYLRVEVRK